MLTVEMSTMSAQLIDYLPVQEISRVITEQIFPAATVLAQDYQSIESIDVLAQMKDAFKHFIESGQVWALGIGIVLGYMFRAFTAY